MGGKTFFLKKDIGGSGNLHVFWTSFSLLTQGLTDYGGFLLQSYSIAKNGSKITTLKR